MTTEQTYGIVYTPIDNCKHEMAFDVNKHFLYVEMASRIEHSGDANGQC